MVIKSPLYGAVRLQPQPSRPLQLVLNGLNGFGHAVLVLSGLVTIFAGFVWERSVTRLSRALGNKTK